MRARFSATFSGASFEPIPALRLSYKPLDTPPARVKKAWRTSGRAERETDWSTAWSVIFVHPRVSTSPASTVSESWQRAELRIREADRLEQAAHAGALHAGEAGVRGIDVARLVGGRLAQGGGAGLDAEVAKQHGLVDGPMHLSPHAFGGERQRLKVDVSGKVDRARRHQRIGVGMRADRLQRVAGGAFGMAIVDHQRGALGARDAPAEFERNVVGAPLEDLADLGLAQALRHHLLEQGHRVASVAEHKFPLVVQLDHALVPAVDAHHRLLDRQRVEELVGEDDGRSRRNMIERRVPLDRDVAIAESAALPLFQLRTDLDEMHNHCFAERGHRVRGAQKVNY